MPAPSKKTAPFARPANLPITMLPPTPTAALTPREVHSPVILARTGAFSAAIKPAVPKATGMMMDIGLRMLIAVAGLARSASSPRSFRRYLRRRLRAKPLESYSNGRPDADADLRDLRLRTRTRGVLLRTLRTLLALTLRLRLRGATSMARTLLRLILLRRRGATATALRRLRRRGATDTALRRLRRTETAALLLRLCRGARKPPRIPLLRLLRLLLLRAGFNPTIITSSPNGLCRPLLRPADL